MVVSSSVRSNMVMTEDRFKVAPSRDTSEAASNLFSSNLYLPIMISRIMALYSSRVGPKVRCFPIPGVWVLIIAPVIIDQFVN